MTDSEKLIITKMLKDEDVTDIITKEPLMIQYLITKGFKELDKERFFKYFRKHNNEWLHTIMQEVYTNDTKIREVFQKGIEGVERYKETFKEISNNLTKKCNDVECSI